MNHKRVARNNRAFTLVELLVVIAIIGILISVLVPAISHVRNKAKGLATQSQFNALNTGLESYRGTQNLGGSYPPSAGDDPDNPFAIADPAGSTADNLNTPIAGGHLLVQAMLGADGLGPPGFIDADRDGRWVDDTHSGDSGVYKVDQTTGVPDRVRYGGGGGFVSAELAASTKSLGELHEDGTIVAIEEDLISAASAGTANLPLFVDSWNHPILYYKANKAALFMAGSHPEGQPTVYRQEDNGIITGTGSDGILAGRAGADFGASTDAHGHRHLLSEVKAPGLMPDVDDVLGNDDFEHTFARFIFDPNSKARNQAVRRDSFLLISAGTDGVYGNEDDITNWQRAAE